MQCRSHCGSILGASILAPVMKFLSNARLFGLFVLIGMLLVLVPNGYEHWTRERRIDAHPLTAGVKVTEQIRLGDVVRIQAAGYKTLIDLRPDGEAADQPSSERVGTLARASDLDFAYVPVPHGDIPDSAVDALSKTLAASPRPVLLYCRSGRRAVRTWSLAEASRPGGLDAPAIVAAAKAAGHTVDDLLPAIARRIAARPHA